MVTVPNMTQAYGICQDYNWCELIRHKGSTDEIERVRRDWEYEWGQHDL